MKVKVSHNYIKDQKWDQFNQTEQHKQVKYFSFCIKFMYTQAMLCIDTYLYHSS